MDKYKVVRLKNSPLILRKKGIYNNCYGIIIDGFDNKEPLVMFLNLKNYGEYVCDFVDRSCLEEIQSLPDELQNEMKDFVKSMQFDKAKGFTNSKIKEYDLVELIVEKDCYAKHGVHKGMVGAVMSDHAIEGKWFIIFSEKGTGKDIAGIPVHAKDLKIKK